MPEMGSPASSTRARLGQAAWVQSLALLRSMVAGEAPLLVGGGFGCKLLELDMVLCRRYEQRGG